jgi:hypothetical protein
MKHSLRLFSVLILLVIAGSVSSAFAQSTRFAFVNKERNLIYIHEGEQKDTLFLPVPAQKFRAERLAVLGSTADGKSLLVGGQIYYAAVGSGAQAMVQGFFRIPIPEHGKQLDFTTLITQGKILRQVYENTTKILPLGVITPDGQRWFGTWMSAAPNNPSFKVYHGRFDQNGDMTNTDSAEVTGADAFDAGYHMSNLTTTEDGVKLLFVVVDKLTSGGQNRARIGRWVPGTPVAFTGDQLTAQFKSIVGGAAAIPDLAFGFAVRGIGTTDNAKMQLAVATQANNDEITIYEIQNVANPTLSSNQIKGTINRAILPSDLNFFTGWTPNEDDVYSEAPQLGNGGDMMFSRDGQNVIFVVREWPEQHTIRPAASAIYEYGLTSGQVNLLWNDVTKEERQPIFVDGTGIIPLAEQKLQITPSSLQMGTVVIDGSTKATQRFTIKNVGTVDASVTEVSMFSTPAFTFGANSLGATAPYAFTLAPEQEAWFDVNFMPESAGATTANITVKWSTDSSRTFTATGTGQTQGSVARDYREVFTFSVAPNPVQNAATISLKGVETSNVALELVDATGRTVWSATSKLTAGSTSTFDLNAQNLAAGSYFLVVRAADVQGVSQVVITK